MFVSDDILAQQNYRDSLVRKVKQIIKNKAAEMIEGLSANSETSAGLFFLCTFLTFVSCDFK